MRIKRRLRIHALEQLESRHPLTAEGAEFSVSQNYDVSGLGGTISASIQWGDGQTTAASVSNQPAASTLRIRLDYSTDTSNFFADNTRRDLLQRAADTLTRKLSDTLLPIAPDATNTWNATFVNPTTGNNDTRANLSIAANELVVFVGARPLSGNLLAFANRGGFNLSATSQAFADAVRGRGQTGALSTPATDFGPWGGSLTFDPNDPWHFGLTTEGLDSGEFDFMSIATHELMHILGFGTTSSFDAKVSGNGFTGANAIAAAGVNPVPLADGDHFSPDLVIQGQTSIMVPSSPSGRRVLATRLDLAALQDIGWQLIPPQVRVTGTHVYGDNANLTGSVVLRGSTHGEISYPLQVAITNVAPTLVQPADQTAVAGIPISLSTIGSFTDPGFGISRLVPPLTETFTYTIQWGDGTPNSTGTANIATLGSSGVLTQGTFGGVHTYTQSGNYTVRLTVTDDDGGSAQKQFSIAVAGKPELKLALDKSVIQENAGSQAVKLLVTRVGFPTTVPLTVSLSSSDTTEATAPASVIIPAGQGSVEVWVNAIDDTLLDGSVQVNFQATADSISSNIARLTVEDAEAIVLQANVLTFREDAGAGVSVLRVSRSNTDTSLPLTVQLHSSDSSELTLPTSIQIPSGQQFVTVGINAVDDSLFDGIQSAIVTATAAGYANGSLEFAITDYQPLALALQSTADLQEDSPSERTTSVDLQLRSPAPAGGVTVQLIADKAGQLQFASTVIIPQGQTQIRVPIEAIDNYIVQGRRTIRIQATGTHNLIAANVDVVIADEDHPYWTKVGNIWDANNDNRVDPLDALNIINAINARGSRVLNPNTDRDLKFVDPNMDGSMDPLDVLLVINEINRRFALN